MFVLYIVKMNKEYLRESILFIILLLFCGFYFFFDLGNLSAEMWDESRNAINALEMRYDHSFFVTHFDGQPDMWNTKPPLFIWTAAFCMKLFGTTVFALRFPSALSAFFIAIYCFWFSRKYLNNVLPGFFAGLVLATSVGFVDYHVARNGDFDCMLSMWIFFYCTQFFLYLESQKKKHLILASLCLAFAILTKGIAGCLFLPGLILFSVIDKNHRTIFKKRELYIISLSGFILGISYYFIREFLNHGYIAAVIENEITGRYANAIEDHSEPVLFYLRILSDFQYSDWLYWLLPSFLIIMYTSEGWFKKLGKFLFISIICNLIVITLSQTKLKWYDAPLYSFMGLLIGLGVTQTYLALKKIFHSQNQVLHIAFFVLFSMGIFAAPFKAMFETSVFRKKEQDYKGLFYGDFLENYFAFFPNQHSLKIISYGYNPHVFFYIKKYQYEGRDITNINAYETINYRDTIMLCDTAMWPKHDPPYLFDTIYREGSDKLILTIKDSIDISDSIKIAEKKLFRVMGEIESNPEWFSNVQEKSKKEKIDLKQQLMYDALYYLVIHKMMSIELQGILKKKHNLLK